MKKLIPIVAALVILAGCTANLKEQNKELQAHADSLQTALSHKTSTLNAFDSSFKQIETNLALINEKEKNIHLNQGDINEDTRSDIVNDIQAINSLLDQNKKTIANLSHNLKNYKGRVSGFKKLINRLNNNLNEKEQQIVKLKEDLTAANFSLDILNVKLDSVQLRNELQNQVIQVQTEQLYTAYYIVGTYKDLSRMGVVEKKGDIIGIAGSKVLKDNFKHDSFIKVDTRNFTKLSLNASKVKLITTHPGDSYSITGDNEKTLVIKDPKAFWSTSRYLVIMVD